MPAGGAQQPLRLRLLLGAGYARCYLFNYQQLKHPRPAARISRIGFPVLLVCFFAFFTKPAFLFMHVYAK